MMMSKWLLAARKKLGGAFPRPDARRQMERYAAKLQAEEVDMESFLLMDDDDLKEMGFPKGPRLKAMR